ncbi:Glycosyltransferase like family 2 [Parafrankia irregularis]|uniref:Glycosyltransferase like family 2 n=1 Tax=Parafrankia irregularis TaxID=795642 RepID=A0A0S4QIA3_9ACTN|nr:MULTISPECIES: glycosyltransferase [Parafrankia]CUU54508.1 Glycosyltransferase like family 2 [Parafrankia irregularis]
MAALATAFRPPERIIVVRLGGLAIPSQRASQPAGAESRHEVLNLPSTTSFGVAVAAAVSRVDRAGDPDVFYWLLHDGAVPAHDALDRLLTYARVDRSAAVLGPSLHAASDNGAPQVAGSQPAAGSARAAGVPLEAGVTVDRAGRRVTRGATGLHDAVRDVLAVSCTGMLIRAAAWERLGGLAVDLTAGLDLDLGVRAARAGLRVVAVPRAVVAIRPTARVDIPLLPRLDERSERSERSERAGQAGQAGSVRAGGAARSDQAALDRAARAAGMRVRLALTAAPLLPFALIALGVAGAARACARLSHRGGRWHAAVAEVWVVSAVLAQPWRLARLRRRAGRRAVVPRRVVRELLPRRPTGTGLDLDSDTGADPDPDHDPDGGLAAGVGVGAGSQASLAVRGRVGARNATPPRAFAALTAVLLTAGAAAVRRLPADLVGGGVPMPRTAGDLWSIVWSGWHDVAGGALGWAGPAPPWTPGLALLASIVAPVGLDVPALCSVLLALAPAVAASSTYLASARITGSARVRVGLAALYAVSPPMVESVVAGRLETAVALAVLPTVLAAGDQVLRGQHRAVWFGDWPAWRLAVGLAVVVACAPLLAIVALVGLPVAFWASRRAGRRAPRGARGPGAAGWSTAPLAVGLLSLLCVLCVGMLPLVPAAVAGRPGLWAAVGLAQLSGSERTGLIAGAPGDEARATALWLFVVLCVLLIVLSRLRATCLRTGTGTGSRMGSHTGTSPEAGTSPRTARGGGRNGAVGWALAGAGLLEVALAVPLAHAWPDAASPPVATAASALTGVWVGPQYGLACAGLLIVIGAARMSGPTAGRPVTEGRAEEAAGRPAAGRRSWGARGASLVAGLLTAVAVPAFAVGFLVAPATERPDEALARSIAGLTRTGGTGARVLVLRGTPPDRASYTLATQDGPGFPQASPYCPSNASGALARLVADLSAGVPDAADGLAAFGVVAVVTPEDADPSLLAALDAVGGLWRDRLGAGVLVWRPVDPATGENQPAALVRLVRGGAGTSAGHPATGQRVGTALDGFGPTAAGLAGTARLPAGTAGRRVVLAEPADPGWRATLDGRQLPAAVVSGWAQAFDLPEGGGLLRISYDHGRHRDAVLATAVAAGTVLTVGVLAALTGCVPTRRLRRRPPARQQPPVRRGGPRDAA